MKDWSKVKRDRSWWLSIDSCYSLRFWSLHWNVQQLRFLHQTSETSTKVPKHRRSSQRAVFAKYEGILLTKRDTTLQKKYCQALQHPENKESNLVSLTGVKVFNFFTLVKPLRLKHRPIQTATVFFRQTMQQSDNNQHHPLVDAGLPSASSYPWNENHKKRNFESLSGLKDVQSFRRFNKRKQVD